MDEETKVTDTEVESEPAKEEEVVQKVVEQEQTPVTDGVDWKAEARRFKASLDEQTSKNGELTKQLRAFKTDEEIRLAEIEEEREKILKENKEYKDKEAIATYTAGWLGKGFDEVMASEAAIALHSGDFDKVIDLVGQHQIKRDKQKEQERLNAMQNQQAGNAAKAASDIWAEKENKYKPKK